MENANRLATWETLAAEAVEKIKAWEAIDEENDAKDAARKAVREVAEAAQDVTARTRAEVKRLEREAAALERRITEDRMWLELEDGWQAERGDSDSDEVKERMKEWGKLREEVEKRLSENEEGARAARQAVEEAKEPASAALKVSQAKWAQVHLLESDMEGEEKNSEDAYLAASIAAIDAVRAWAAATATKQG